MYQKIEVRDEHAKLLGWIEGDFDLDEIHSIDIAVQTRDETEFKRLRLNAVAMVSETGRRYEAFMVCRDQVPSLLLNKMFSPHASIMSSSRRSSS